MHIELTSFALNHQRRLWYSTLVVVIAWSSWLLPSNVVDTSTTSAFSELLVARTTSLLQLKFPYALLNSDYVSTVTNGVASVSGTTNFAQLQAGTLPGAYAILTSKYRLNYQPGEGCVCFCSAIFNAGVANSTQLIGIGNFTGATPSITSIQDGFFFGYNGATFGLFQYTNSTATFTAQSSWNVDPMNGTGPSGMTLDPTKGNVYKIQYCWLGFGHINFYVENSQDGTFALVHVIQYPNSKTVTSLLNPSLQLVAAVLNNNLLNTITLKTPCLAGMIEGYANSDLAARNSIFSRASKAINTTPRNVLTIRNNTSFNGVNNQVMVYPDMLTILGNSTTPAIVTLYINPTVGGTPAFTNINATSSVVSYDVAGTTITAGTGRQILTVTQSTSNQAQFIDLSNYNIVLAPGDILVVAVRTATGTSTFYAGLSWVERF